VVVCENATLYPMQGEDTDDTPMRLGVAAVRRAGKTVYGVIYPPQLGLVGFGAVVERPWVVDGQVLARPLINATLSADHRATDGHRGAIFLDTLARLLQEPEKL